MSHTFSPAQVARKVIAFLLVLSFALTSAAGIAGTDAPLTGLSPAAAHLPLTPANAAEYFAEATRDCRADDGKLWSVSLCGPMLFVDPATRQVIASQADADGRLKPANDGTFAGVMSPDQIIANTCAWWSGTQWIEVLWPIPASATMGRTIMAHEAYHCVQKQIVPIDLPGTNAQLETVYGRYTMQLEWRALAAALKASTDAARRQAASDALLFRVARYHSFPKAQAREVALERDEGLAEYTGVMVGNATATQRKAVALELLREGPELPSFVSSFAYITGPAYGLLLDRYRPDWRKQIIHNKQGLAAMLAPALHLKLAHMPLTTFAARAAHYGGDALLASENTREAERNREIAHYRALLVTGPVLVLPLKDTRKQYNSLTLLSLGRSGTVYPTLRLFDVWGSIDVKKGALMAPNQSHLTVAAPSGGTVTGTIHGPGWTLKLLPGWRLARGVRKGDFTLQLGPMQRGGQRSSGQ